MERTARMRRAAAALLVAWGCSERAWAQEPAAPPAAPAAADREAADDGDLPSALPAAAATPEDDGTSALATGLDVKPAPFNPGDRRFPINLAAALRLADARPLIVAAAQAGVWVSEAELTRAKLLWVPTLNIGFDYVRHDGGGPDFNKGIMTAPSVNFFYGGGGLTGTLYTADAIFQPLAARQVLNAAHWNIQAAKNDALLQTSDAYFRVHQYRGTYAGALYSVRRGRELVGRIQDLSRDLVPKVEIDRARNMLADLEQKAVLAQQEWRVAGADLTQVLRLDPRAVVEPLEHDHAQITLIDPGRTLDDLMPVALVNRPELAAHQALVQAAVLQIRAQKWSPLIPTFRLNGFQTPSELIQAGIFGLGPNASMNQWRGRADVSIQSLWELEALGLGNLARIKEARGRESQAIIEFYMNQDAVAADVTRARARVQSAAARVLQADRSMRTAVITFNGNYEGLRQTTRLGDVLVLVNRPQEAVFALQLLMVAFDEYFATVAEYNRAQFELFHALGYPARELTVLRSPGDAAPVDTSRPDYLPPVGVGPPPATR
ncbi:TolC family protein [Paludisphaera mucosa]|uniref:TolC family protein n=1 Tax=Paludisphaera mucosa TaxID=3030827 RepID=A0ABT6FB58_9BACT|nr:TolC family protein [Paludisphaera mucosa]MDG3004618.1 TolC family protein [Paludisphaera mucosa]